MLRQCLRHRRTGEGFAVGEKKWRNLGSLLLSNLNWLLAVGLLGLGFLFLHFPRWTGDASPTSAPQTAATLVGALWGSAALLLGAQVNEWIRSRDEERKNLQNAENFKRILFAQFRNVINNAVLLLRHIGIYIKHNDGRPVRMALEIRLQNKFLSHDFMYENLYLLERYINELIVFHQSIETLCYETMFFMTKTNSQIDDGTAYFILDNLDATFQSAVALAQSMWPDEQIKIGEENKNLVEYLQQNLEKARCLKNPQRER